MVVVTAPVEAHARELDPAQVRQALSQQGVKFLLSSFVELSGVPKAKLVPLTHLEDVAREGAGFAGFAAGHLGQGPDSPDIMAMPDLAALLVLPWRPDVAWVPGDLHVAGQPSPYCPRGILKRQIARAAALGYTFKTGIEPEFFLVRRDERGRLVLADALDDMAKPCYDQRTLTRTLDFLTTLIGYMQELGWDPYANDHEDANGQFEIDWAYSDCLTTADRYVFMRYMVKVLAEARGWIATFMPKPFAHLTGNGAHVHMSLWDAARSLPLFDGPADPRGLGLSPLAYHFIAGLTTHARALAAVTAPTVNSYKRLIAANARSGATWAPIHASYGGNNRTQMLRVPAPGRIENRTVDGACNPYLTMTVLLAAGLDGIERGLDPGPPNERNMYDTTAADRGSATVLPATLAEAVDALEGDSVVRAALGDDYAAAYIAAKRDEWESYHNSVSAWEIEHYVDLY